MEAILSSGNPFQYPRLDELVGVVDVRALERYWPGFNSSDWVTRKLEINHKDYELSHVQTMAATTRVELSIKCL